METEDELTPADTRLGRVVREEFTRLLPRITADVAVAVVNALAERQTRFELEHRQRLDSVEGKQIGHGDRLDSLENRVMGLREEYRQFGARLARLEADARGRPTDPAPPPEAA